MRYRGVRVFVTTEVKAGLAADGSSMRIDWEQLEVDLQESDVMLLLRDD